MTTLDPSSCRAHVGGSELQYLVVGSGEPVILLHGYTQTSHMWRPIIPLLAQRFTVIAPDLPGIGGSEIPAEGIDMKSAAVRVRTLARALGFDKVRIVGHDIGLMVAYAYAAQFPGEVEKLALLDAFLPGVGAWQRVYNDPYNWHFTFNGPTPEALVQGRERIYLDHYWNDMAADKTRSVPEADRALYTAAYARPGRMRASWAYFHAFLRTANEFEQLAKQKLAMPVLAIGGDQASGVMLAEQARQIADDVKVVLLRDTGHWLMEERLDATTAAISNFL